MSASGDGLEPRRGEMSPAEREALKRRAESIGKRLDEVKARTAPMTSEESRRRGSAMGQAFRISIELVAGVAVGGFIGWVLDRHVFGFQFPAMFMLFLVLGFAAGLLNVIRSARRMQAEAEPLQRQGRAVKDDEDES